MGNVTATINPYESPRSTGAGAGSLAGLDRALAVSAIVLSTLLALVVLGTQTTTLPRMLDDFDADLPAFTQIAVSPAFAMAVSLLAVLTIVKERMLKRKAIRAIWNTAAIILVLLFAPLYALAFYLTTIQIGEKLS